MLKLDLFSRLWIFVYATFCHITCCFNLFDQSVFLNILSPYQSKFAIKVSSFALFLKQVYLPLFSRVTQKYYQLKHGNSVYPCYRNNTTKAFFF